MKDFFLKCKGFCESKKITVRDIKNSPAALKKTEEKYF